MEFPHGRSDGFYITAEDDQEEASKSHAFLPPASSSPSSSSSSAHQYYWNDGSSGSAEAGTEQAGGSDGAFIEKEHMFDKVVTPSDVGKLNRLVIPKQHAERFFPLDTSANERGLLLCFEDRTGKPWRFRYSYWNSSQSYVMTKGWSRFVKEKRLDAGDTVSFGRGVGEAGRDRLFIDWKHRPENHDLQRMPPMPLQGMGWSFAQPWPPSRLFVHPPSAMYNQSFQAYGYYDRRAASSSTGGGQFLYFNRPEAAARPPQYGVQYGGSATLPMVHDAVPLVHNQASTSKRVRLFGVNLECPDVSGGGAEGRSGLPTSSNVLHLQPRQAAPLLRFPPPGSAESSAASSPSTSKEQHSSLDLDL